MFMSASFASLYVALDGNDPKGVTSVKDKYLSDWEKDYTMIKVGEEYRGKNGYEIKYDGSKLRLATQQEIDNHLNQVEVQARENYLKDLKKDMSDANLMP